MEQGPVVETLLFVLIITAITVLPFVLVIGGVMFLRWRMIQKARAAGHEPEPDFDGD